MLRRPVAELGGNARGASHLHRPLELKDDGESTVHPTLLVFNSLPLGSLRNGGEGLDVHPGWGWELQLYALPVRGQLQVAEGPPMLAASGSPGAEGYHTQVLSCGVMAGGVP